MFLQTFFRCSKFLFIWFAFSGVNVAMAVDTQAVFAGGNLSDMLGYVLLSAGVLSIAVFLAVLFTYVWVRFQQHVYGFFACFSLAIALFLVSSPGSFDLFTLVGFDPVLSAELHVFWALVALFLGVEFSKKFIDLATVSAPMNRVAWGLQLLCGPFILLGLFGISLASMQFYITLFVVAVAVFMAFAAFRCKRRENTPVIFLTIGWLVMALGIVMALLMTGGVFGTQEGAEILVQDTILLTLLVFTFGLVDKMLPSRSLTAVMADTVSKDTLTRLMNRKGLEKVLPHFVKSADASGQPFSLALVDIDNFSTINDSFGREGGDKCLRALARVLWHQCRDTDLVVRYGGEEFVLILSNAGMARARDVCERIRQGVHEIKVETDTGDISPTVSVGVREYDVGLGFDGVMRDAFDALRKSKESGRDRVTTANGVAG